jgi:CarD family transcriptional regulator
MIGERKSNLTQTTTKEKVEDWETELALAKENGMMFQIGDTVIHPGYGAGTVVKIEKLQFLCSDKPYYSIVLSDGSKTCVWVAVTDAGKKGIRRPTRKSQLGRIWRTLRAEPETLPSDHDERYELLQERLRGGDIFRTAEVVRDMFWQDNRSRRLTIKGKQLYDRGLTFLTSEVAVVQGCDSAAAEAMISDILGASLAAKPAV